MRLHRVGGLVAVLGLSVLLGACASFKTGLPTPRLALSVTQPFYRNNIYATESLSEVRATVDMPRPAQRFQGARLVAVLRDAKGNLVAERSWDKPAAVQTVALPASNLAAGEYVLSVALMRGDHSLGTATATIRKLPKAPGTEVRVDEQLRLRLNGKPFFPLIWWSTLENEPDAKATGADGIIRIMMPDNTEAIDRLHKMGQMAVMMTLNGKYRKLWISGKDSLCPEARAHIAAAVERVKAHPALLCYYLIDEPEYSNASPEILKEFYEFMKELDPYHPVLICNNKPSELKPYADCTDMFVPDPYVIPRQDKKLSHPMTRVALAVDEAKAVGNGRKFVGLTPEVFSFNDYGHKNKRAPTFYEMRCYQYLGIVHGARMLQYYVYRAIDKYPELRHGVTPLVREVKSLREVFVNGLPEKGVSTSSGEVHLAAWRHKGQLLIVTCNTLPEAAAAVIRLPDKTGALKVVSEGRSVTPKNGQLVETYLPYEVRIFTTDPAYRSPVSLDAVQKAIEGDRGLYRIADYD